MEPALWQPNPKVYQNATWDETITYYQSDGITVVNLSGYTAAAMFRGNISDLVPLVSLTDAASADGQVILGGVLGTIRLLMNPVGTRKLSLGTNMFEVWLYPPAQIPPYSQPIITGELVGLLPATRTW